MSVIEIEKAIVKLPAAEVNVLADWLNEYREQLWDKQIDEDAKAGRLDAIINQAKQEIKEGKVQSLG